MITIKTDREIALLREGGKRLAGIMKALIVAARPGVSTRDLDILADQLIRESGGEASFRGYSGKNDAAAYPAAICASVNDAVVHTIPDRKTILQRGDVLALDIGMRWPGDALSSRDPAFLDARAMYTDMAVTVSIGEIAPGVAELIRVTREALAIGISAVRPGARVGDISHAIQSYIEPYGFGIVRDLAGHGVGYAVHEDPLIPNVGKAGRGAVLEKNMALAIEPIVNLGDHAVVLQKDGWSMKTADHSVSAHFEHTLVVTQNGAEILTVP